MVVSSGPYWPKPGHGQPLFLESPRQYTLPYYFMQLSCNVGMKKPNQKGWVRLVRSNAGVRPPQCEVDLRLPSGED
jgi:hypothetical protein